jgi:hypothetical protein
LVIISLLIMSIDFRKNANVLTAVHAFARPKQRTPTDPYVEDGFELHATPELIDRLKTLLAQGPGARLEFAYGTPMLCTSAGRVFATAGGKYSLYLYLPEEEMWGEPCPEYGKPWRAGYAWTRGRPHTNEDEERLASLVRFAYSSAMAIDTVFLNCVL